MNTKWLVKVLVIVLISSCMFSIYQCAPKKTQLPVLMDFEGNFDIKSVETTDDVKVNLIKNRDGTALRVITGQKGNRPGIMINAPGGEWDLSDYLYVEMDVKNTGTTEAWVSCRLNNKPWITSRVYTTPGKMRTLKVFYKRSDPPEYFKKYFTGMKGMPGGFAPGWSRIDSKKIFRLFISFPEPQGEQIIEIDNIRASGSYDPPSEEELKTTFFPFIDKFAQYKYKEWPGKIHSFEDFEKYRKEERVDLDRNKEPVNRNRYGGWEKGPKLKATGYFRPEKYREKWWLVDPEGRLFWSHGIDCVRPGSGTTPITEKKHYFEYLPEPGSPESQFYNKRTTSEGKTTETFNLTGLNLFRKYGEDWKAKYSEISHKRLRSWGLNTIANWSDADIYLQRKTPYVVSINYSSKNLKESPHKFPDVFDPDFKRGLQERMASEKGKSANDSWCLGYFVDNELSWGDGAYFALLTLKAAPDLYGKKILINDLKAKYEEIKDLNRSWGTEYSSWDDMLQSREAPDKEKAFPDLNAFDKKVTKTYFRTCREAVKEAAPNNLYLGCRISFHFYPNEQRNLEWAKQVIGIAGEYCDVISFNRYRYSAKPLVPPEGTDKPLIIGEWQFGAMDRGMIHPGPCAVPDQELRGESYIRYVSGALENPFLVGTHWFLYADQAVTGRFDGENYQLGFLDICDTPYMETVNACRSIGYSIYKYRNAF
ncbi:MAG TPA: beta-agarase [bacterium]|nr:beta-agarase [bacterium]